MLHVIALAVLPAIILIYYTYQQDKLQREPVGNIVKAFFYGWGSVFASLLISMPLLRMGAFPQEITSLELQSRRKRQNSSACGCFSENAVTLTSVWTALSTPCAWVWALRPLRI